MGYGFLMIFITIVMMIFSKHLGISRSLLPLIALIGTGFAFTLSASATADKKLDKLLDKLNKEKKENKKESK